MCFFIAIIQGQIKLGLDVLLEIFGFKENVIVGELGNLQINWLFLILCNFDNTIFISCYTTHILGIRTDKVFNVSSSLDLENIQGHSRPHVFKIIKEDEHAVIFWKKWSTDPVSSAFHHSNGI